jgi:hypothetical protein
MSFIIMSEGNKYHYLKTNPQKELYLKILLIVCAFFASAYDNKCKHSLFVNPIQVPEPITKKASKKQALKAVIDAINFMRKTLSENGYPISEQPVLTKINQKTNREVLELLRKNIKLVVKKIHWSKYTKDLSKTGLSFPFLEQVVYELLVMV